MMDVYRRVDLRSRLGICDNCILSNRVQGLWHTSFERHGTRDAKLLVLVGSPEFDGASSGRPLIGSSGRLIRKIMMPLIRDYTVASVVQCTPSSGSDRKPKKDECNYCFHIAQYFIKKESPSAIMIMGALAMRSVLPKEYLGGSGVGDLTMALPIQIPSLGDSWVGVNYDPSYIMRTGGFSSPYLHSFRIKIGVMVDRALGG